MRKISLLLFLFSGFLNAQILEQSIVVLFNSNDYSVNLEGETILNSFFSDETIVISTIEIKGFCDDVGSIENNAILSLKRAESLSYYLQDNFNLEVDSIKGKGEIEVSVSDINLEEIRKNNRKAILKITYSKNQNNTTSEILTTYSGYKKVEDKLNIGDKILLENTIFKESLTHFINIEVAESELLKIIKYLKENPLVSIEIQGHVCCISKSFTDARDLESGKNNLSKTRAKKIYDFFLSKGISKNRMTHTGFGRKFPLPNTDELLNKRVEIVIVKM